MDNLSEKQLQYPRRMSTADHDVEHHCAEPLSSAADVVILGLFDTTPLCNRDLVQGVVRAPNGHTSNVILIK